MRIVVTVDPASLGQIDRVAGRLTQAGMTVDQILSATGIITGSVADHTLPRLRGLAGVAAVEPDTDFPLTPDTPR